MPEVPAIDLTNTGIDLHSGDPMAVHITYDGTVLGLTITDSVTLAVWFQSFAINIPATIGGNTAYVGFTGGSGSSSASQKVLNWTFLSGPPLQAAATQQLPNFANGFSSGAGLVWNGPVTIAGNALQLTDYGLNEANSVYFSTPVGIQTFNTQFSFQLSKPVADGFTFVLQNQGTRAVGNHGAGLGYQGMANSFALKFDIHNNAGEGNDSTGVYLNGASPTVPATDLTNSGIVFSSGDVIQVQLTYDGTTLTVTLTDPTVNAVVTKAYAVNIPKAVGGSTAYAGFTAGTGGSSVAPKIESWTYTTP